MFKLILGAAVALAAVAVGATLGEAADAPSWLVVVGAVLTAVVVPLGAFPALAALVARMPEKAQREVALVLTLVAAGLEAVLLTAVDVETWLHVVYVVLVAIMGALGIRMKATPTVDPRNDEGVPLLPAIGGTGAVTSRHIRDGAVTARKIRDGTITGRRIR